MGIRIRPLHRHAIIRPFWLIGVCMLAVGCTHDASQPELVWGRRGNTDGRLQKPRAIALDVQDRLFIADKTGRIQVFDRDGSFLKGWETPQFENGMPCGLSIDREGNLLVADTHYFRVLTYTPDGELLKARTIGGTHGSGPGEFGFVTDAVQDAEGNYYVAEYGDNDRIQCFAPDGEYITQWGEHGSGPGQFIRPQSLEIAPDGKIWVADSCNHRIQVFRREGKRFVVDRIWGVQGKQPGQLWFPYAILLNSGHIYVCEYGNHRVQKFTLDGKLVTSWGRAGRRAGELTQPWGIVKDSQNRLHILDTYNHRVQRIQL